MFVICLTDSADNRSILGPCRSFLRTSRPSDKPLGQNGNPSLLVICLKSSPGHQPMLGTWPFFPQTISQPFDKAPVQEGIARSCNIRLTVSTDYRQMQERTSSFQRASCRQLASTPSMIRECPSIRRNIPHRSLNCPALQFLMIQFQCRSRTPSPLSKQYSHRITVSKV